MLFASTPASAGEFEVRGIPLLVEVARQLPDVEFLLPWRKWSGPSDSEAALAQLGAPANFRIAAGNHADMAGLYASVHATICLFASGFGKSCPNSVMEGLGCGRPAIVTATCGIADLIADAGAGVVAPRAANDVAAAIETLRATWTAASRRARALAERSFNQQHTHARYAELYQALAAANNPLEQPS